MANSCQQLKHFRYSKLALPQSVPALPQSELRKQACTRIQTTRSRRRRIDRRSIRSTAQGLSGVNAEDLTPTW
jgi:hypothetical protein